MNQVHKENLTHVENANPGRAGLEVEIFGMEGVPAEIIDQHVQQVTQAHFAEEQERARITGNPIRGLYANGTAAPNKRPKVSEALEDIETRAEKFRVDRINGVIPQPAPAAEPVANAVRKISKLTLNAHPSPQSPSTAFPGPYPPQHSPFPPANGAVPPRPGSIPGQPGVLPPRPGFAAPPGAFPPGADAIQSSLDDLIAGVQKEAAPEAKKPKKDKNMRLIYGDDSISPEEKMAMLPRFAQFARV